MAICITMCQSAKQMVRDQTHSLLLASAQDIPPFFACAPPAFPSWNIREVHSSQDLRQLFMGATGLEELWIRVGVDNPNISHE